MYQKTLATNVSERVLLTVLALACMASMKSCKCSARHLVAASAAAAALRFSHDAGGGESVSPDHSDRP